LKRILIVAGEPSGDLRGAELISSLKEVLPQIDVVGVGGIEMLKAGARLYYNITNLAVVGFIEVLRNVGKFRKIFKLLTDKLNNDNIQAVVLIDYPGFNLRFAREAKKRNIPVIYYISPQVWAWGERRIELIKKLVNKMIVVFKFEEELYRKNGIDAEFVGHPLLDVVKPNSEPTQLKRTLGIPPEKRIIALLPGSRKREVKRHLPVMVKASKIIQNHFPQMQFLVLKSSVIKEKKIIKILRNAKLAIKIVKDKTYDCLNISEFVLTASGTATLETALMKKPMIVIYKTSFLTYLILKPLIKIPNISLVNVVAGKRIVPEFIQYRARAKPIANKAIEILSITELRLKIKRELSILRDKLGEDGASRRAAKIISEFLRGPF
jgi:lipid-A-disaccharide synthase